MPKPTPEDLAEQDVEILAIWLHYAAKVSDYWLVFRLIIKRAAWEAAEMYADENPDTNPDDADFMRVRQILTAFASKVDELQRQDQEDE